MKLKTLYKRNKNKSVSYLELSTRKVSNKDEYYKIRKTGILNKSKNSISKVLVEKGKNIGRKNETTCKDQAEKELRSEWTLELMQKGWKDDLNKVPDVHNTFYDDSVMPMLLNKYSSSKFKPGYAQKKYDGVRCVFEKHNGKYRLKSRKGNVFNVPHILDQMVKIASKQADFTFDGELYLHNTELHDIISVVKKGDPEGILNYHIYDVIEHDLEFTKRRNIMLALDASASKNIYVDSGKFVGTKENLDKINKSNLMSLFEGTILCNPDSLYDAGFRSSSKVKIKPRVTDEFECVDQYWNKGKMSKQTTLICKNSEGKTFHVKLKGTSKQREQWAKEFDTKIKNKMITVEYRKLSKYKTPIEGVGVAVRDYE